MNDNELRQQVAELRRQVRQLQDSSRIAATRSAVPVGLPSGQGRFKVMAILDESATPAIGWDDVRFRLGDA